MCEYGNDHARSLGTFPAIFPIFEFWPLLDCFAGGGNDQCCGESRRVGSLRIARGRQVWRLCGRGRAILGAHYLPAHRLAHRQRHQKRPGHRLRETHAE